MMKNLRFVLSLIALICFQAGYAQLTINNDQEAYIDLQDGVEHFGYFQVANNSGVPIAFEWKILTNTLNNNWELQFCDCSNCYVNSFPPSATCFDITDGSSQEWKVGIDKDGAPFSEEEFSVEILDKTNGIRDTLVWKTQLFNGVVDLDERGTISTYPNPVKDILNVNLSGFQSNDNVTLHLMDLTGRIVNRYSVNTNIQTINLEDVPNGIYILDIRDGQESVTSEKIIVNH